jgi:hypothetical protein
VRVSTECAGCGIDVNRYGNRRGVPRTLDWEGVGFVFCSSLCEFLWRRRRLADNTLIPVASRPSPMPQASVMGCPPEERAVKRSLSSRHIRFVSEMGTQ